MTTLRPDLQGQGTYDYACREPGCLYCKAMGLTPLPEILYPVNVEIPEFNYRSSLPVFERRKTKQWSGAENRILRDNRHKMTSLIMPLLPGRSKQAIEVHASKLKKLGVL